MWSNTHPVHHSQDLGKYPGVLRSFPLLTLDKSYDLSKILEITKSKYEHTLIYTYIRYINHQNMFLEHVHPSLCKDDTF